MTKQSFIVKKETKKDKIRKKIISLLSSGQEDWKTIRKIILTDPKLNAFPAEFKKVEDILLAEGVIKFN